MGRLRTKRFGQTLLGLTHHRSAVRGSGLLTKVWVVQIVRAELARSCIVAGEGEEGDMNARAVYVRHPERDALGLEREPMDGCEACSLVAANHIGERLARLCREQHQVESTPVAAPPAGTSSERGVEFRVDSVLPLLTDWTAWTNAQSGALAAASNNLFNFLVSETTGQSCVDSRWRPASFGSRPHVELRQNHGSRTDVFLSKLETWAVEKGNEVGDLPRKR